MENEVGQRKFACQKSRLSYNYSKDDADDNDGGDGVMVMIAPAHV